MTDDARYSLGLAVRRSVPGEAHVARASAAVTPFHADLQRFITVGAWGSVWSRPASPGASARWWLWRCWAL